MNIIQFKMGKLSNSLTNKKIKEDKENFFHVEKVINKRVRNGNFIFF